MPSAQSITGAGVPLAIGQGRGVPWRPDQVSCGIEVRHDHNGAIAAEPDREPGAGCQGMTGREVDARQFGGVWVPEAVPTVAGLAIRTELVAVPSTKLDRHGRCASVGAVAAAASHPIVSVLSRMELVMRKIVACFTRFHSSAIMTPPTPARLYESIETVPCQQSWGSIRVARAVHAKIRHGTLLHTTTKQAGP